MASLTADQQAKATKLSQAFLMLSKETRKLMGEAALSGIHFPDEAYLLIQRVEESSDQLACFLRAENYLHRLNPSGQESPRSP